MVKLLVIDEREEGKVRLGLLGNDLGTGLGPHFRSYNVTKQGRRRDIPAWLAKMRASAKRPALRHMSTAIVNDPDKIKRVISPSMSPALKDRP